MSPNQPLKDEHTAPVLLQDHQEKGSCSLSAKDKFEGGEARAENSTSTNNTQPGDSSRRLT